MNREIRIVRTPEDVKRHFQSICERKDRNITVCLHCGRTIKIADGRVKHPITTMKNCRICVRAHGLNPDEEYTIEMVSDEDDKCCLCDGVISKEAKDIGKMRGIAVDTCTECQNMEFSVNVPITFKEDK